MANKKQFKKIVEYDNIDLYMFYFTMIMALFGYLLVSPIISIQQWWKLCKKDIKLYKKVYWREIE